MVAREMAGRVAALAASIILMLMSPAPAWAATFVGTAKVDQLAGTRNADIFYGLSGWDYIVGRAGPDEIYGGKGSDSLQGKYGNDYLVGGRGDDELEGWQGNDRIEAADGRHDYVGCGPGEEDRASVDGKDFVKDCEIVNGERTG
jgi:Ca2+-binding RTX toxin-like protein